MPHSPSNFRDYAAVVICGVIIGAYISIGYVQMAFTYFHGAAVAMPSDWNTTMQSLSNIALGYLIAKTMSALPGNPQAVSVPVADPGSTKVEVSSTSPADPKPAGA